jgi:Type IX secretion system protein PorV
MKKTIAHIILTLLLVQASSDVFAQYFCKDGYNISGEKCANAVTSAIPFLRIVPDARGGSMGDVGIATSPDANSMHYNPSKMAFADKKTSVSATYTPWMRNLGLNDVYLAYLSGYHKLDEFQAIGLSLRYFSLGDIEFTGNDGESLGQGKPNEFEVCAGYSRKLSDKLSAAIGAKFVFSNLATGRIVEGNEIKPGKAGAADLSFTYKSPIKVSNRKSELTIGAALSNLGSKITYTNSVNRDFIPANLGIGAAWKMNLDDYNTLTFTMDFNKLLVPTPCRNANPRVCDSIPENDVPDYKERSSISGAFKSFGDAPGGFSEEIKEITTGIGVEYWYDDQFAVRSGYFFEHYSKGNRKYFSVGLGVKYNIFGLNFSYLVPTSNQRNPLDNTLRFSLLFDFEAFEGDE